MMSFFSESSEAERYAASRPYFHPLAIERARQRLGIEGKARLAVDIACGTGQSAAALTAMADQVFALDFSWSMLNSAIQNARVGYVQARAEALPFPSGVAPILSCALAFHWFDRAQFLGEARRVLSPNGYLLIYTNGFTGAMREEAAFRQWAQKTYSARFPVPPRDSRPLTSDDVASAGFELLAEERYQNDVIFSAEELVAYLATQTNVAAALRQGTESLVSASRWLLDQVRPYFKGEKGTFVFVTRAWYLKKVSDR